MPKGKMLGKFEKGAVLTHVKNGEDYGSKQHYGCRGLLNRHRKRKI